MDEKNIEYPDNGILICLKKMDILAHAPHLDVPWGQYVNERSQKQKDKYYIISLRWSN